MTLGLERWLSLFASAVITIRHSATSYPRLDLRRMSERDLADLNLPDDFEAKVRRLSLHRNPY